MSAIERSVSDSSPAFFAVFRSVESRSVSSAGPVFVLEHLRKTYGEGDLKRVVIEKVDATTPLGPAE